MARTFELESILCFLAGCSSDVDMRLRRDITKKVLRRQADTETVEGQDNLGIR